MDRQATLHFIDMETTRSVDAPDEGKVKCSQDGVETVASLSHHRSRKSSSSRSSTSSRVSLEAARARAKAEAAKIRLTFTEKESEHSHSPRFSSC